MRSQNNEIFGAPEEIRTPDPQIRSLAESVDNSTKFPQPALKQGVSDQGLALTLQTETTRPQNETPAALAGATGAEHSNEQRWEDTFIRVGLTSPVRHARAGITMITVLRLLRHGRDHTDELAQVFSEALGPRELTLVADATGMALSRRLEPQL